MKIKIAIIGLTALLAAGCLTPASKINSVSIGMSKAEVLQIMGTPVSVTADAHAEYLNYALAEGSTGPAAPLTPYEVKIVDGKVASYSRAGNPAVGSPVAVPIVVPMVR
jgi:hypothetical protein